MFHTYLPTVDFSKLQPFTQMSSSISFTDHADVSNKCSEFIEMFLNLGRWCKSDFFREIYFILTMNNNCCAVRSFAEIFIIFPCSWHEWHLKNKEGDSWSKYYHGCMQVFFSKKNSRTFYREPGGLHFFNRTDLWWFNLEWAYSQWSLVIKLLFCAKEMIIE